LEEPSLEDSKAAADEQQRELEACVSLAQKLYGASGAEQVWKGKPGANRVGNGGASRRA